jgi:hypothetical protein
MDSSRDRSNTAGETIADPTEENDIEANSTIALSVTTFFFSFFFFKNYIEVFCKLPSLFYYMIIIFSTVPAFIYRETNHLTWSLERGRIQEFYPTELAVFLLKR